MKVAATVSRCLPAGRWGQEPSWGAPAGPETAAGPRGGIGLTLLLLALLLPPSAAQAASFSEPSTVFYGKIFGTGGGQPFLATAGTLDWTIRRADGSELALRTTLFPMRGGEFSYRLDVPHSALASGLTGPGSTVPMRAVEEIHQHFRIAVDGLPARVLGPGSAAFVAGQAWRTATHRLDLEVSLVPVDADGDGIPDWWEEKHGLEDPNADVDGDGLNSLAEFRNGSDPRRDDRVPSLATPEIRVYAEGTTVARLRAIDTDSAAADLRYTLISLPAGGGLVLRGALPGAAEPDVTLAVGAGFTQAEIDWGRLVFVHEDPAVLSSSFLVALQDEDPAHAAVTNRVAVHVYRPTPALSDPERLAGAGLPQRLGRFPGRPVDEWARLASYVFSRDWEYVVCDAAGEVTSQALAAPSSGLGGAAYAQEYVPSFGPDRRHVLHGGLGADELTGSMEPDILIGGRGNDRLRGGRGGDLFVILAPTDGNDIIEDFAPAEGDVLDISQVLTGTATALTSYVQVTTVGADTLLGVNFSGAGTGYTDMTVTLAGTASEGMALASLVDGGHLVAGDKTLPARVTIVASQPVASENGPVSGALTLSRSGSAAASLAVNLQVTGSAVNGVDYEFVSAQAVFAAGSRTARVTIVPYIDATTELAEAVDVAVLTGTGYEVGAPSVARVTIEDLAPQIAIEALEPFAVAGSGAPGLLLVTRSGVLDRSILVRLVVGGTAVNGTDYARINSYVNLAAGETARLIEIMPSPGLALPGGARSVLLSVKSDPAYRLGAPAAAQVLLVEEVVTLAQWRTRHFPGFAGTLAAFAAADPGGWRVSNLERYAFGLDPLNPDRARLPRAVIREGHLTMDVWRRPEATDVELAVEVSPDLRTWNAAPETVEAIAPVGGAGDPGVLCYRAHPPVSAAENLFMRVRVIHRP